MFNSCFRNDMTEEVVIVFHIKHCYRYGIVMNLVTLNTSRSTTVRALCMQNERSVPRMFIRFDQMCPSDIVYVLY